MDHSSCVTSCNKTSFRTQQQFTSSAFLRRKITQNLWAARTEQINILMARPVSCPILLFKVHWNAQSIDQVWQVVLSDDLADVVVNTQH